MTYFVLSGKLNLNSVNQLVNQSDLHWFRPNVHEMGGGINLQSILFFFYF